MSVMPMDWGASMLKYAISDDLNVLIAITVALRKSLKETSMLRIIRCLSAHYDRIWKAIALHRIVRTVAHYICK